MLSWSAGCTFAQTLFAGKRGHGRAERCLVVGSALLHGVAQQAGESNADRVRGVSLLQQKTLTADRLDLVEMRLRFGDVRRVFGKPFDQIPGRQTLGDQIARGRPRLDLVFPVRRLGLDGDQLLVADQPLGVLDLGRRRRRRAKARRRRRTLQGQSGR